MRFYALQLSLLIAVAAGSVVLVSYVNAAPAVYSTPAVLASPSPALGDRPPAITASYAGQQQRGVLRTYCWKEVCGDTFLFVPTQPITVLPGATIEFELREPLLPAQWLVRFFVVGADELVPWSDPNILALRGKNELARAFPAAIPQSEFQMPERAGDYAVSLSGQWRRGPDYGSDAFYGFHVVVRNSPAELR